MAAKSLLPLHICFYFFIFTILMCSTRAKVDNYIVHMDLEAMPKAFSDHRAWYKSTIDSISTTTLETSTSKLLYTYTHVIRGFSASLTPLELEALKASPGYLHSTLEQPVVLDTTYTSKFLGLNPLSGAWPVSDYGKDVIIGVIDTGVWPESKSYNDDGYTLIPSKWKGICQVGTEFNSSLCNKKLIGAQYFNKGLLASSPDLYISMNSARDTQGHGTHTSSTAAGSHVEGATYFGYGNGISTGMAPRARVAIYKALWHEGSSLVDILAAVDTAIIDGVDVISMSLGFTAANLYDDVVAIATFAAIEKGIFVSLSAGNDGPLRGTLHNGTPWALTVAAGTVDRTFGGTATLGNGVKLNVTSLYPESTTPKNAPLANMNECDDLKVLKRLPNETIVVCFSFNETTLANQIFNLELVNVTGVIFITNQIHRPLPKINYLSVYLDFKSGRVVTDYIKTSFVKPTITFDLQKTYIGSTVAPKVALYSSRGPSPTSRVVLKPDLMAPGDLILASWAGSVPTADIGPDPFYNDFNIVSGTSMACPHASGVAALIKGAHPDWSAAMIRSAMMTTSDQLDSSDGRIRDLGSNDEVASALAMGAGHINPNKAMEPGLVYDADYDDYVNLLCGFNYTKKQMKVVTRSSHFNCSNPSTDLNYPSFILVVPKGLRSIEKVFTRTVTNVGDGPATYTAKVANVDGIKVRVEPYELVFREMHGKLRFNVTVTVADVGRMKQVVDTWFSWFDSRGKYLVRSPVVVTNFSPQDN